MNIESKILATLDEAYEENYYSLVDVDEVAREPGATRQEMSLAAARLIAEGWIEELNGTMDGHYDLQLTEFGKEQHDARTRNTVNSHIRERLLAEIAQEYERDVHFLFNSDDLAGRLGVGWNKACFNLEIMASHGLVRLENPSRGATNPSLCGFLTPEGYRAYKYPPPKIVFLSHAATDAPIAGYLKGVIEARFPNVHVFVSTDCEDIGLGKAWVEKVLENLHAADVLLALTTRRSIERKWVWFETGAAWGAGLDPIPCSLGDIRFDDLPHPFTGFQGTQLGTEAGVKALFENLADVFEPAGDSVNYGEIATWLTGLEKRVVAGAPESADEWVGTQLDGKFVVYSGPVELLPLLADEPHDPRILPTLEHSFDCRWAVPSNISNLKSRGYGVAYQTDKETRRRRLVNNELVLMVRPKIV